METDTPSYIKYTQTTANLTANLEIMEKSYR